MWTSIQTAAPWLCWPSVGQWKPLYISLEMGFSKPMGEVYLLTVLWLGRLALQAGLSWGITLGDSGGSDPLRRLVSSRKAKKINFPPLKFSKQEDKFRFRLKMDENGEPEFPQWLQTVHLQHGFLWDMVGGLQQKANAPVGFQCLYREGWANTSLRKGRKGLATSYALLHHSHLCTKVSEFMLAYWRFPPQLQLSVQAWMSYLLI